MRIVAYAQHLSGVGHFVRMSALARGLSAGGHEVHLVSGGRAVPRAAASSEPKTLTLPLLARTPEGIVALDRRGPLRAVMAERVRLLTRAIEQIRPDAVLVDHYPFSKWELEGEINAAIDVARRANPRARILCSLRDVVRQTRHEHADGDAYGTRVLAALGARFDAILVHADPRFTRLEDHFVAAREVAIPVVYTGFVLPDSGSATNRAATSSDAVLSCGGGIESRAFVLAAMAAFRRLAADGTLGSMRLIVFTGAFAEDAELAAIETAAANGPFQIVRFSADFARHLDASALSISRAGYNTCAALLHARARAVLVPDPVMSDQEFRARRLAELGLATVVEGREPAVAELIAAMRQALSAPPPQHDFDLNGVAATRAFVEQG